MHIAESTVVSFDYTLTDDENQVLDTSEGREPLQYIHGVGMIVPGLEKAMEGRQTGEAFRVDVAPEEGYGQRREDMIQSVPREMFRGSDTIEPGMTFTARTPEGGQIVTVTEVTDKEVTVDANHPLAGKTLHFDVTIREVRAATPEELDHGHVHGPNGHEH